MTASLMPRDHDPVQPAEGVALTVTIDGEAVTGSSGQTLAGVLLAAGRLAWRNTSSAGRPRGVFCGIGVCYDCVVEVNGQRDVRTCLRRASDGDVLVTQHEDLPGGGGNA